MSDTDSAFEFADRVYLCDYCGSQQPDDDKPCPDCGWTLFTWAGFLGRSDRYRVGTGETPKAWRDE
jgi:hypothetical protein